MNFHLNKKYNFTKGLTLTEIIVYGYIGLLSLTAIAGIITVFGYILLNPVEAGNAMDNSGFNF
jgi:hypothetical protein|tara:strand:- start:847 stop:1035 length:189 start_codon:yes stop_codon:yes gene_type:complete